MNETREIDRLKEQIRECRKLPTLPGVAAQLVQYCFEPDAELGEIARILGHDPALSAKVLKVVNSPFYGLRKQVTTLSHAVALLGFNSIRTLALSFSLVRGLRRNGRGGFDYAHYWRRSVLSGAAARALGLANDLENPEELLLAGLLQDIGLLALQEVLSEEYGCLVKQSAGDHILLQRLEMEHLGVDHAQVGGWLAEMWQLPEVFQISLCCSHDPDRMEVPEELLSMVQCVSLSGWIADIWMDDQPLRAYRQALQQTHSILGMEQEAFESVLASIDEFLPNLSVLFDIRLGGFSSVKQVVRFVKEQSESPSPIDSASLSKNSSLTA
ncbi:MAG: HDOD domain-containing protein [Acidobacteriota bacterium]